MQFHAMLDNLISRTIGGIVRTMVVVIGSLTLLVAAIIGLLQIALWPLIPALPVIFVIFAGAGWVPWTI